MLGAGSKTAAAPLERAHVRGREASSRRPEEAAALGSAARKASRRASAGSTEATSLWLPSKLSAISGTAPSALTSKPVRTCRTNVRSGVRPVRTCG
jgi:hypothetical protein